MEKLERPTPEVIAGVKRQLMNAGLDPDTFPMDWIEVAIAATHRWQQQTQDGLVHTVNLLRFDHKKGLDDTNYDFENIQTGTITRVLSHKVHFFAGAAVNGRPVNPHDIIISKKILDQCEGCGVSAHCLKDVRDARKDSFERLCNNCITLSDNGFLNQQGDARICRDCTVLKCVHHPLTTNRLALKA